MTSNTAFLMAAFDAQGANFAAVFQGLDSHRLRVIPAIQSSNGSIPQDFVLEKGVKVSALEWTISPPTDKNQQSKKRKKVGETFVESSSVIALGTTQGTVLIYSPATNSIVANLKTGSSASICSIAQPATKGKLLVMQTDGTLTEFDLTRNTLVASSVVPVADPASLIAQSELIIANTAPHLCKNSGSEIDISYSGFATPVRQLLMLGKSHFAAVAEEDRQVLVYSLDSPKPVHSLMCPSTNAIHISCSNDLSAVAVTTEDGQVHVFEDPTQPKENASQNKSKRAKQTARSSPKFSIETVLVKRNVPLVVNQTRFADNHIVLVWPEQGSVPIFDSVNWRDENGNVATDNIKLEKQPSTPLAREHLVGGVDPASAPRYEEQAATITSGEHVADLSDEEAGDNNDDDEGETLADRLEALEVEMDKRDNNKKGNTLQDGEATVNSTGSQDDDSDNDDEDDESTSAKHSLKNKPNGASAEESRQSRLRRKELKLKLAQPGSFATLLNQALTLNDKQLLEICLEERDPAMIKVSIVKLKPALAASLLEHLASTMARSQNRSTTLTQWIRWVVVIHGAYLVTLPNLLKTLAALHSTLSTRASTLPRLLALQGRLDLLEEQLAVREEVAAAQDDGDEPEAYYDEEEALIVNGEEANDDLSEDDEVMESDESGDGADAMEDDDATMFNED